MTPLKEFARNGNLKVLAIVALTLYIVIKDVAVPLVGDVTGGGDRAAATRDFENKLTRLEYVVGKLEDVPETLAGQAECISGMKASIDRLEKKIDNLERK